MSDCPCGSGKTYEACCGQYISGIKLAPGPEELMRARYTAHVKQEIDFIVDTHNPERIHRLDRDASEKWAAESDRITSYNVCYTKLLRVGLSASAWTITHLILL